MNWLVEWVDKDELARLFSEGVYDIDDGICEASIDAACCEMMPNKGLAVARAKQVLPQDDCGEVRITPMAKTPHPCDPTIFDWEPCGETEYVTEGC